MKILLYPVCEEIFVVHNNYMYVYIANLYEFWPVYLYVQQE